MTTTRMRVTLREVTPPVARIVDVPDSILLPELHDVLQVAIGWTDSHLHRFETDSAAYGMADVDPPEDEQDEEGIGLAALGSRFTYWYDFGDGWEHDVEVLGPGDVGPGCRYGEGTCPPEDCGGPSGYEHLLHVLADPRDPDHDHLTKWASSWARDFDQDRADVLGPQRDR